MNNGPYDREADREADVHSWGVQQWHVDAAAHREKEVEELESGVRDPELERSFYTRLIASAGRKWVHQRFVDGRCLHA